MEMLESPTAQDRERALMRSLSWRMIESSALRWWEVTDVDDNRKDYIELGTRARTSHTPAPFL